MIASRRVSCGPADYVAALFVLRYALTSTLILLYTHCFRVDSGGGRREEMSEDIRPCRLLYRLHCEGYSFRKESEDLQYTGNLLLSLQKLRTTE